jgi:hypothetical protein
LSGSPTGTGNLAYEANIKQLWPNPNQISGAQNVWNHPPLAPPDTPVTFRFRAEVDPQDAVHEKNEGNNVLVKEITVSKYMLTVPPPGGIKKKLRLQAENRKLKRPKQSKVRYPRQGQVFIAPARFSPRVQGLEKVRYTLKKKVKGRWIVQKPVNLNRLNITVPGFYCLTAMPENQPGAMSECVPFEVKAKKVRLKPKSTPRTTAPAGTPAGAGAPNGDTNTSRRIKD